jgi:hypothetical protein
MQGDLIKVTTVTALLIEPYNLFKSKYQGCVATSYLRMLVMSSYLRKGNALSWHNGEPMFLSAPAEIVASWFREVIQFSS